VSVKLVRLTVRPTLDASPPFVEYLLDSPDVAEAQAIDWNRGHSGTSTHLYAVDGDDETFGDLAAETAGVVSVERARTDGAVGYVLLEVRDDEVPLFGGAARAVDRSGLVVRRPLVYREGRISAQIVGDPAVLQATLDEAPDAVSVAVDEIRTFPGPQVNPATVLSSRQREAVEAALELGYYETPRGATHEDVAAELGCAPNTASQHLQKAEAKLVGAQLDAFDATI
jgi:predicted DNA binding protein